MNFGTQPIFTQLQSAYSRIMRLISTTGQRIWNADDREIGYHSIFRKSSSNLVDDGFKIRNLVLRRHPCEKILTEQTEGCQSSNLGHKTTGNHRFSPK